MSDAIETTVLTTVAEHFGLLRSSITPETRFEEDLGAEDGDIAVICMNLDDDTGADLFGMDLIDISTVADLIKATRRALGDEEGGKS